MPLIGTIGSLAEFKQGYTVPNAVSNVTITRNKGYDITVNFDIGPLVPPGLPETYFASTNVFNYSNSSSGNSIQLNKMNPLTNYTIVVSANNVAGGNSNGNSTQNSYYMSSNLTANGNIAVSNISGISIAPNGNQISAITSAGRLLQYSRNSSTGLLTLAANVLVANANLLDSTYSPDGNFIYIVGRNNSTNQNSIYNVRTSNNNVTTGISNSGFSKVVNTSYQPIVITASPDNKSIIVTGYSNSSATSQISIFNYSRNTITGNLTLFQSAFVPAISNAITQNSVIRDSAISFDNKNLYLTTGDAFSVSTADVAVLARNTSNTNLSNLSFINRFNLGAGNIICSNDNLSVYVIGGNAANSITAFSRDGAGNLTNIQTVTSPINTVSMNSPADTILLVDGATYKRNVNGTLSLESSHQSYDNNVSEAVVSTDNKNVYGIWASNITIFDIGS